MLLSWCGWHMQVLSNFMEMLTWAWYDAFVAMAEGKGCHGGETEMVPRQHPGSGNSIEMLVQRNKCGCAKRARVTGSDPGYRCPTCRWHGLRRMCKEQFTHGPSIGCISYNTCIRSTDVVSGLYLRSVPFRSGSGSTVVEVVVSRDGSRSRGTRWR